MSYDGSAVSLLPFSFLWRPAKPENVNSAAIRRQLLKVIVESSYCQLKLSFHFWEPLTSGGPTSCYENQCSGCKTASLAALSYQNHINLKTIGIFKSKTFDLSDSKEQKDHLATQALFSGWWNRSIFFWMSPLNVLSNVLFALKRKHRKERKN